MMSVIKHGKCRCYLCHDGMRMIVPNDVGQFLADNNEGMGMNTNMLLAEQKVSEIVIANPIAMGVFDRFGIDFCCGGKLSLETACRKRNVALEDVEQALVQATVEAAVAPPVSQPDTWSMDELVHHIVATHHAYVQAQTPEILRLLDKVSKRHGDDHPELHEIHALFQGVSSELAMHMKKEEFILFPWIKRLSAVANGEMAYATPPFGSVANPIQMMEQEHEAAGGDLAQIHSLTNGYTLPEGACMSYWQVYQLLDAFEKDLHRHVHLENNILFPKAIALESQLSASTLS